MSGSESVPSVADGGADYRQPVPDTIRDPLALMIILGAACAVALAAARSPDRPPDRPP